MSKETNHKDHWYERWMDIFHPKQERDSRKVRRRKEAAVKKLNDRVTSLLTGYFEAMHSYERTIDKAGLDVNTRQGLMSQHRELVLRGLDTSFRDWLRLHPEDYVYDACASLFVARVVEITRSQANVALN